MVNLGMLRLGKEKKKKTLLGRGCPKTEGVFLFGSIRGSGEKNLQGGIRWDRGGQRSGIGRKDLNLETSCERTLKKKPSHSNGGSKQGKTGAERTTNSLSHKKKTWRKKQNHEENCVQF